MHRATTFFSSVLILLLTVIVSTGFSQGDEHTTLVGRLDLGEFTSDTWGYTDAATGIDYALVGVFGGMAIIDATTETDNPTQVAYVTGVLSAWKDIKTWENYSYLVSEGGGGLQIVDLTDPTNPVLVQNHTADFTNAHNVYIDENGFAYVVGANAASLKENAEVTLIVYSILGNKVATVYSGRAGPGRHEFEWNGRSDDGIAVSSGIYLYRLEVGVNSLTRKMVLLK